MLSVQQGLWALRFTSKKHDLQKIFLCAVARHCSEPETMPMSEKHKIYNPALTRSLLPWERLASLEKPVFPFANGTSSEYFIAQQKNNNNKGECSKKLKVGFGTVFMIHLQCPHHITVPGPKS